MIGVFSYTVILTYASLISACLGIIFSLSNASCPYIGAFFLLFCGLCDAFDGKVASTKKNRSDLEKKFGIQIDSLSDLVAFGVLPMCIGVGVYRSSSFMDNLTFINYNEWYAILIRFIIYVIFVFFVLAALIRLAYFNVTEEERQKKENGVRKTYVGLPVTASALIFPLIIFLKYFVEFDISLLYFGALLITGILFLLKFQVKKFDMKGILFLVLIGVIELILLLIVK